MTTVGYKNVPFTVHVAMHSAIHAVHYVNLNNGGDGRLTFPSGGTNMFFTPVNWATPQDLVVNFNGVGDAELLADITNDYFVNGAGAHRSKQFIINLSVTELPLDSWIGSVPGIVTGNDGGGNLKIAHNCVVGGHTANIGINYVSGQLSSAGASSTNLGVLVTRPDGSTTVLTGANSVGLTMNQLGVWTFEVGADPGLVITATAGTKHIQASTFVAIFNDTGTTVTSTAHQHQGAVFLYGGSGGTYPTLPNGGFNVVGVQGPDEVTCVSPPVLVAGPVTVQSNCTGCTMASTGSIVSISGTRVNAPFTMSANGPITATSAGITIGTDVCFVNG